MGLRGKLTRLERAVREEMIEIPQQDGTVKRFPRSAGKDAFMNAWERLGAGENAPPEHPLIAAARNSSDPEWSNSFYAGGGDGWTDPGALLGLAREKFSLPGEVDAEPAQTRLATLEMVDLSYTNLDEAKGWTVEQLASAKTLEGATMPDGQAIRGDKTPNGLTFEDWLKSKDRGEDG